MKNVGQENIKKIFSELIKNDKLGHAYILSGPKGIGKRTLANDLTEKILCDNHESKLLFIDGAHPEFTKISTEEKSIGVDEIRQIQKNLDILPVYSEKKVLLIEDGEKMTAQAQNALLKTIEEPPKFVCIIITVSNYEPLLSTIKSRAIRFMMENYSTTQMKDIFKSRGLKYLDFYNSYAGGNIGKALAIAESEVLNSMREEVIEKLGEFLTDTKLYGMDFIDFLAKQKDNINYILDILSSIFRDALVYKEKVTENMLINSDKKDMIINIAVRMDKKEIIEIIERIIEGRESIKKNANYQMTIDWLIVNMI